MSTAVLEVDNVSRAFGGVQAVTWTDVKQMVVIVLALFAAVAMLILGLPSGIGIGDALHVGGGDALALATCGEVRQERAAEPGDGVVQHARLAVLLFRIGDDAATNVADTLSEIAQAGCLG